jgi:hypothetical protein
MVVLQFHFLVALHNKVYELPHVVPTSSIFFVGIGVVVVVVLHILALLQASSMIYFK